MKLKSILAAQINQPGNFFYFTLIITFFLFYFSPFIIKGVDVFIESHDNLDSINMMGIFDKNFKGKFFLSNESHHPTLPGIDQRFTLRNMTFEKLLFYLFGYFGGYVLNEIIIRIIAFIGMFFLIKKLKGEYKFPILFQLLAALSFTSLPFPSFGFLTTAGLPMLAISYINLFHENHKVKSYLYIIFFGFYSSFVFVGFFIGVLIIFIFLYLLIVRKLNKWIFIGSLLLLTSYLISHYNLFFNQIFYDFQTNRSVIPALSFAKNFNALKQFSNLLYNNQYHAPTNHSLIILPCVLVLMFDNFHSSKRKKLVLILISYIFFSAIIVGLSYSTDFVNLIGSIGGFTWNRFYSLNPLIWYILWTLLLIEMYNVYNINLKFLYSILFVSFIYGRNWFPDVLLIFLFILISILFFLNQKLFSIKKNNSIAIIALLITQISLNTYFYTYKAFIGKPSFKDFFSSDQFEKIISECNIDKSTSRIGCIGFYPSVANYNGLKTLGAYENIYPLEYKNNFYEIIKEEILKNEFLNSYFTKNAASRLYLYDDQIGKPYYDQQERIKLYHSEIICELNTLKMQQLGTTHIFSTVKIKNYSEKNLKLVYVSKDPEYFYDMYIYILKD